MKIGIDIGGTKCAVVLGDESGIRKKIRFATTGKEETLERILTAAGEIGRADAVGISCGGPLDDEKGLILSPPNLPGWDRVPIVQMVEQALGVPAYLCNDANACALAEWKYGAGRGTKNMVFLTFGTGLGAGLILNGRLYTGTNGMAGEVGHLRLSEFGPVGYGKRGSFEGFCSGGGLAQIGKLLAMEERQAGRTVSFCSGAEEEAAITAKRLAEAADAGDAVARNAYRISGEMLGRGLAVIVDLFNPECIVIGSIFARSEDLLREAMEETLHREALPQALAVCRIVPAALGEEIGDYAALAVALEKETKE